MLFRFPLFLFNPRLFFVLFLCFHSICHSYYLWPRIFETHSQITFRNISSYQKIDLRLNSFDLGKIYIFHLTLSIFSTNNDLKLHVKVAFHWNEMFFSLLNIPVFLIFVFTLRLFYFLSFQIIHFRNG